MNLIEFAQEEFKRANYPKIKKNSNDPSVWIQQNVLELIEVFRKQGHSGSYALYVVDLFSKLANRNVISPIMGRKEEWIQYNPSIPAYQNKYCSGLFKQKNTVYYIDAIIFKDPHGSSFSSHGGVHTKNGELISSKQLVKLPFIPKTFYIDVDSNNIVKDETQLDKVFKYYYKRCSKK